MGTMSSPIGNPSVDTLGLCNISILPILSRFVSVLCLRIADIAGYIHIVLPLLLGVLFALIGMRRNMAILSMLRIRSNVSEMGWSKIWFPVRLGCG